jgi:hypothetical protein
MSKKLKKLGKAAAIAGAAYLASKTMAPKERKSTYKRLFNRKPQNRLQGWR